MARRGANGGAPPGRAPSLVLYVEGPLDRDVLGGWAERLAPRARPVLESSVILGGRRPERAVEDLELRRVHEPGLRGLCVLDRDGEEAPLEHPDAPGLAFYTWSRRHIESYLLVPAAIGRCLRRRADRARVERCLRQELPAWRDEERLRTFDAKRVLARDGALARTLGRPLRPGRIARAMRDGEFHEDVLELFRRLREALAPSPAAQGDSGRRPLDAAAERGIIR